MDLRRTREYQRGFSLVEIVLALGLTTVVLVAILGLFSTGLTGVSESERRVEVANVGSEILEQRFAAPLAAISAFPLPALALDQLPANGMVTVDAGGRVVSPDKARFRLTYRIWRDVSASSNSHLTKAHLVFTWPVAAAPQTALNSYELLSSTFVEP